MTCIFCDGDVKGLPASPAFSLIHLSCESCGEYEITREMIAVLPRTPRWAQERDSFSGALRWWWDTQGKPWRVGRREDIGSLMAESGKAQQNDGRK